ncbi:MAG: M48 family metallopeptidase [Vulcanisaeta sp. AZ3]|jgi:Zn-dependent protease with chaperone function
MVTARIYQIIHDLIKDPQSLINYIENYLLFIMNIPFISKEFNDNIIRLIVQDENGSAELSINHIMSVKGRGKTKNSLKALILRYLGTDGVRRITVMILKKDNTIYRIDDLPKMRSLPLGLLSLALILVIAMSLVITTLRIIDIIPPIHLMIALLLVPLLIPIAYSYILQLRIRQWNLRGSQIVKFVFEYSDFSEEKFNNALRFLSKIDGIKSLNEVRKFILSLINNPTTAPNSYHEEVIDIDSMMSELGISSHRIYLVNLDQCNAASVGIPGLNYIILTSRLVSCLNKDELMAVIAHEIGHIVHGDSAKTLFLVSLSQLINIALIIYIVPIMTLPVIPLIISVIILELLAIMFMMRLSEYSADKYALRLVPNRVLVMALLRVTWRELYNELVSRRLRIFDVHPTVSSRLLRMSSIFH